jgi:hypothetical protein
MVYPPYHIENSDEFLQGILFPARFGGFSHASTLAGKTSPEFWVARQVPLSCKKIIMRPCLFLKNNKQIFG